MTIINLNLPSFLSQDEIKECARLLWLLKDSDYDSWKVCQNLDFKIVVSQEYDELKAYERKFLSIYNQKLVILYNLKIENLKV